MPRPIARVLRVTISVTNSARAPNTKQPKNNSDNNEIKFSDMVLPVSLKKFSGAACGPCVIRLLNVEHEMLNMRC